MIGRRRPRDTAGKIDQESQRELDHRRHEARFRLSDQNASPGGRCDVDVANIDGAAHHRAKSRQALEDHGRDRRRTISDDEVDAARHADHALRIERRLALMHYDLDQLLQSGKRAGAVVLPPRERGVSQEKLLHAAELTPATWRKN